MTLNALLAAGAQPTASCETRNDLTEGAYSVLDVAAAGNAPEALATLVATKPGKKALDGALAVAVRSCAAASVAVLTKSGASPDAKPAPGWASARAWVSGADAGDRCSPEQVTALKKAFRK